MKISEAHIQQTVTQFMELDGWRHFRTDPVSDRATVAAIRTAVRRLLIPKTYADLIFAAIDRCIRGKGFGEPGMPDDLFIRYGTTNEDWPRWAKSPAELMWIEFKAPGKLPEAHQLAWHDVERARGGLVKVVDDIDGYIAWYIRSGLARRVIKPRK